MKKRTSKEIEKDFSKYISKESISEILEVFNNAESEDVMAELNKKAELNNYEIIVLYTNESDIQKWLEKMIPKLKANHYMISPFFGNFLFASRKCENGFEESVVKEILDDKTKMAVFIKNTQMVTVGTENVLNFAPKINFGEDFLEKFAKLEYGKYMLFADENKELHL